MKTLAVILLFLFSAAAKAQNLAIVPFPPGGGLDALTRIMTQSVAEQTKIRVPGIEPAAAMSAEQGARWIAVEHDKWAKVIREKNIKAE